MKEKKIPKSRQKEADIALLEKLFYIDPTSPSGLRRKIKASSNTCKGDVAGCLRRDGRWIVGVENVAVLSYRIVYILHTKEVIPDGLQVDHIDGDRSNNTVENLRLVDNATNGRNIKKRVDNTSGVTGVSLLKDGGGAFYWVASWYDPSFKKKGKNKWFSINKFGYKNAFMLAVEYRKEQISKLNDMGCGYTERHGL